MIFIADRADGGAAVAQNLADFAGRQTQNRVAAFRTQDLCGNASGTCQLAALARLQFNVVNESKMCIRDSRNMVPAVSTVATYK